MHVLTGGGKPRPYRIHPVGATLAVARRHAHPSVVMRAFAGGGKPRPYRIHHVGATLAVARRPHDPLKTAANRI